MKRLVLLLISFSVVSASAVEIRPLNLFKWLSSDKHERVRVELYDPVVRPRRVPLMDVRSCGAGAGACVILNGRKIELEAAPMDLWHQRVQVVGRTRGPNHTGVFARVRFSPWHAERPEFLLVWASIRNRDRVVKIQGYSVDRDQEPGVEYNVGPEVGTFAMFKYLTSKDMLEVEVARELLQRQIFCLKYPAEPMDTIRDEVSTLQHANLVNSADAAGRLIPLQTLAGVIDIARGRLMCETPITDQMDGILNQVRDELQTFVRKAAAPTVTPKAPRVDAAPKGAAPVAPKKN